MALCSAVLHCFFYYMWTYPTEVTALLLHRKSTHKSHRHTHTHTNTTMFRKRVHDMYLLAKGYLSSACVCVCFTCL
uniref:Putative secreted protein n=1 Tax=Anopheles darlingi TaxID=43151 RepID=A0A2M4DAA2_ANODA